MSGYVTYIEDAGETIHSPQNKYELGMVYAKDGYYEWLSSDAVWGQCFGDNAPDNLGGALCCF